MPSTMASTRTADTVVPHPAVAARPAGQQPAPAPEPSPRRLTGRFNGDLVTGQWWWSPELFALQGLDPAAVQPSAQLLLAHVHQDDRAAVREALGVAGTTGTPFTREHRLVHPDGHPRRALLVCEPEADRNGRVVVLAGLVVHLSGGPAHPAAAASTDPVHRLETEVEQLRTAMASRAAIEQAKGILMLLMGCGDQVAFDLLAHISSHTHRKVRDVAVSIIDSASGRQPLPADVRDILHDACPPGRRI
ncbi:PAS and ANTAR domain-containing protein [Modestobacter roseus]|nr:PAS and ANTAR domain-containing protein [Modestobacter roseus]MQA33979.1 ANTAR domain-containing protein [Modestobacter roseus]